MSRALNYEFYENRDKVWHLASRLSAMDEGSAREQGQALHAAHKHPGVVIEEGVDSEGEPTARIIWRTPGTMGSAAPPPLTVDLGSRLFMVAICGVAIGAIGAIGTAVVLSAARGKVSGTAVGIAFLAFAAAGALLAFRIAIPVELMLWRNKREEARQKIISVLKYGSGNEEEASEATANPAASQGNIQQTRGRARRGARQTTDATQPTVPAAAGAPAGETPDPAAPQTEESAVKLQEFIAAEQAKLQSFADIIINAIVADYPTLQAFQRYGFNLYLAGAVEELVPRDALTPATAREVLIGVLIQTGTDRDTATTFCDRLATSVNRARYKRVFDAGRAAMVAVLDNTPLADDAQPGTIMRFWSNPNEGSAQSVSLLLTDLVGSTAMTGKLGNAGAQRVVRAHNSIVRAALKNARGTEVKHTGDGILGSFTDPVQAAQAGIEIQQEIVAFCRANPELPLAVRIGLHAGEVTTENGELFGDAVSTIDDVCSAADSGEVYASKAIEQRSGGGIYKYATTEKTVQTENGPMAMFKLLWEPKRVDNLPPIEYRSIGGKPAKGEDG